MDLQVFRFINNMAGQNPFLDRILMFCSSYGIYMMIALILFLLIRKNTRKAGGLGIFALASALLINRFLKITIDRPRPFMDYDVQLLIERAPSPSFPSDQALICGLFIYIMWVVLKKAWFTIALSFGLVVMFSRIFVGHHYPSDVFIGSVLGFLLAALVFTVTRKISSKQTQKTDIEIDT